MSYDEKDEFEDYDNINIQNMETNQLKLKFVNWVTTAILLATPPVVVGLGVAYTSNYFVNGVQAFPGAKIGYELKYDGEKTTFVSDGTVITQEAIFPKNQNDEITFYKPNQEMNDILDDDFKQIIKTTAISRKISSHEEKNDYYADIITDGEYLERYLFETLMIDTSDSKQGIYAIESYNKENAEIVKNKIKRSKGERWEDINTILVVSVILGIIEGAFVMWSNSEDQYELQSQSQSYSRKKLNK